MNTEFDTASVGYPVTRFGVSFFPVYLAANELPEIATEGLIIDELTRKWYLDCRYAILPKNLY